MTAFQRGLWRRKKAFSVSCSFWEPAIGSILWTQWRRSQHRPHPHRLLDLLLYLTPLHSLPFPGFPAPTPKHSVWFLVLGSSLLRPTRVLFAHSSFPLLLSLLAVCLLAQPLTVGMLLLFTSLFLVCFLRHIHSLLSLHPNLLGLWQFSPFLVPLQPVLSSSWAENTLHNLAHGLVSGHRHLGFGRLQARKTSSEVRHECIPVLPLICPQNWQTAVVRIHSDSIYEVPAQ